MERSTITWTWYKFIPKYRPTYRPSYRPVYRAGFRSIFQPKWDALINKRRQQFHKYTREELEAILPALIEAKRKCHEIWTKEAKAHEEAKVKPIFIKYGLVPKYHPVYRPRYKSVYRPIFAKTKPLKARYRCAEDKAAFFWLSDFLSHVKNEHPGMRITRIPKISM
ncbi:MAG: hypothetical protein H3Z54_12215 [archaeon]|nr:hypothetical protein [archaeon]